MRSIFNKNLIYQIYFTKDFFHKKKITLSLIYVHYIQSETKIMSHFDCLGIYIL